MHTERTYRNSRLAKSRTNIWLLRSLPSLTMNTRILPLSIFMLALPESFASDHIQSAKAHAAGDTV